MASTGFNGSESQRFLVQTKYHTAPTSLTEKKPTSHSVELQSSLRKRFLVRLGIKVKQTQEMMMLKGDGDPSYGNGGYSFLKMPLKISADSL